MIGRVAKVVYLNQWIDHFGDNCDEVTWASFNWDCIFESSFYYCSGDSGLNRKNPHVAVKLRNWFSSPTHHTLLKLHGGINWWYTGAHIEYLPFGAQPTLTTRWDEYAEGRAAGHPVILEPSCYKYDDPVYSLLEGQWDFFVRKLFEANTVVILGYSLPEADAKARMALMMGFQSNRDSRWMVVNPDANVCNRLSRLFGNKRLSIFPISLQDFNQQFAKNLEIANK
jgi:hypothetical protein